MELRATTDRAHVETDGESGRILKIVVRVDESDAPGDQSRGLRAAVRAPNHLFQKTLGDRSVCRRRKPSPSANGPDDSTVDRSADWNEKAADVGGS